MAWTRLNDVVGRAEEDGGRQGPGFPQVQLGALDPDRSLIDAALRLSLPANLLHPEGNLECASRGLRPSR
jgi:hypothetical protein